MSLTAVLVDVAWAWIERLLPSSDGCNGRPFQHRHAHDKLLRQVVTKASTEQEGDGC